MPQQVSELTAPKLTPVPVHEEDDSAFSGGNGILHALTQLAVRKWLVARIVTTAAAIGLVTGYLIPTRYTATTKIMPPQQTPSTATLVMNQLSAGNSSIASVAGAGLGLKNPNEIYLGLLNARPVADAIIQQFNLSSIYHVRDLTDGRKMLAKYTQITSEKSGLISISVTDRDKQRAAELANAYTDQLRKLTESLAVTEASQRRVFYEGQLRQAKAALVGAELAFQEVQQKKGLVALDAQSKATVERLTGLHAQLAAKEVQLQALRSFSTDKNPTVQVAERELSALQAQAERLERSKPSAEFGNLSLVDMSTSGLEYLRAQHELLYQQTLYDLLIKQYDAARLDEAKEAAVIQVVEPAIAPERKSSPHRAILLVWFVMLGILAGCAYVLVANHIRQSADLRQALTELRSALLGGSKIR